MATALQNAHIRYEMQVPIKTPYSTYTFLCDFLLLDKPVIIEVQGGLHRRTWGGRPAVHRMAKDEVKKNCLEAYGYKVLAIEDTVVKRNPDEVIAQVREALK
jgi:very-short-patch-repair endonuclease